MGERCVRNAEVRGSIPLGSTKPAAANAGAPPLPWLRSLSGGKKQRNCVDTRTGFLFKRHPLAEMTAAGAG